jgi:hypothetical protein
MLNFNQNIRLLVEEAKKVGFIVDEKFLFSNPNGSIRNLLNEGSYCFGEKVLSKAEDFLDLNVHRIYNDEYFVQIHYQNNIKLIYLRIAYRKGKIWFPMVQHLYSTDSKIVAYVLPLVLDVKDIETNIKPMIKNFDEHFNKIKLEIKKFLVKKRIIELEQDFHK